MSVKIIKTNLDFMYRRKHGIYVFPSVLSFFRVYVCDVHECVYEYSHMCVCRCICICSPKVGIGIFFALSATFFFEAGSLIQIQRSKRISILSLDSLLQVSYLFPMRLEYRWAAMPIWHLHNFWVSELLLAV